MISILLDALCIKIEGGDNPERLYHPMSDKLTNQEPTMEQEMLCAHCCNERPMYPSKNSQEDCNIYCADCYWDLDAERKRKRRSYWKENPEALEAYRKHVAEVLGLPLTKEKH